MPMMKTTSPIAVIVTRVEAIEDASLMIEVLSYCVCVLESIYSTPMLKKQLLRRYVSYAISAYRKSPEVFVTL